MIGLFPGYRRLGLVARDGFSRLFVGSRGFLPRVGKGMERPGRLGGSPRVESHSGKPDADEPFFMPGGLVSPGRGTVQPLFLLLRENPLNLSLIKTFPVFPAGLFRLALLLSNFESAAG